MSFPPGWAEGNPQSSQVCSWAPCAPCCHAGSQDALDGRLGQWHQQLLLSSLLLSTLRRWRRRRAFFNAAVVFGRRCSFHWERGGAPVQSVYYNITTCHVRLRRRSLDTWLWYLSSNSATSDSSEGLLFMVQGVKFCHLGLEFAHSLIVYVLNLHNLHVVFVH